MLAQKNRVLLGAALLMAFAGGARNSNCQSITGASSPVVPVVDSSWPEVDLNVLVLDKHGVPQKVDESEFQLFEDGAKRPLQFLGSPDSPVSLALIIDSSGSIFKHKGAVIAAVKTLVKALPNGSEVMAVLFADKAYLDLPFTPVSKVDFSFLNRFQAYGPTRLYDAVFAAEDYFIPHAKHARRAMVILTDGEDNASISQRGIVFERMEQPGAPIFYSCLVSRANILQTQAMVGTINMKRLANEGGGIAFSLDPDPESTAARIAAAIRSQYVLQFTATDQARDRKMHKLRVRLQVKDVRIHVLPAYFAPAQ